MSRNTILLVAAALVALISAAFYAWNVDSWKFTDKVSNADSTQSINYAETRPPQESNQLADTSEQVDEKITSTIIETDEIVISVYDGDQVLRDKVIAAVEAEMTNQLQQHPHGWIRWRPALINPLKFTNGNFLDSDTIAREFTISPFPDSTFRATMNSYKPRKSTMTAKWKGVLDDGDSGTIEVTVIGTIRGPQLIFHLRTPTGHFDIFPTEVYGGYLVREPSAPYWREQVVCN